MSVRLPGAESALLQLDPVERSLHRLSNTPPAVIKGLIKAYSASARKTQDDTRDALVKNDDEIRRKKMRTDKTINIKGLTDVKAGARKKNSQLVTFNPPHERHELTRDGQRLSLSTPSKKKVIKEESEEPELNGIHSYNGRFWTGIGRRGETILQNHQGYQLAHPNIKWQPFIGVTGPIDESEVPEMKMPQLTKNMSEMEYRGRVTNRAFEHFGASVTFPEKKQAIALKHPDLEPHVHSIHNLHDVPEGSIIHIPDKDAEGRFPKGRSERYPMPIIDGRYLAKIPDTLTTAGAPASSSTFMATAVAHRQAKRDEAPSVRERALHADFHGVPVDHPLVDWSLNQTNKLVDKHNFAQDTATAMLQAREAKKKPITEAGPKFPAGGQGARGTYSLAMQIIAKNTGLQRMLADPSVTFKDIAAHPHLVGSSDNVEADIRRYVGRKAHLSAIGRNNPEIIAARDEYRASMSKDNWKPEPSQEYKDNVTGGRKKPITEEHRHAAGVGERLERATSLRSVGRRIGTKPSPPTNEKLLNRRAARSARYTLRKKLAPNYRNMSTGQKMDVDERIARHPEMKGLQDAAYKTYKKKAGEAVKPHAKARV